MTSVRKNYERRRMRVFMALTPTEREALERLCESVGRKKSNVMRDILIAVLATDDPVDTASKMISGREANREKIYQSTPPKTIVAGESSYERKPPKPRNVAPPPPPPPCMAANVGGEA